MYNILKRGLDIILALLVLFLLLPFIFIIIPVLLLTGEGEVWYFQKRVGYKNQFFNIWKFATMLKNSPNMGTGSLTLRNDPRVTPAGKFLRKTKFNELPQIINVLKGDMSIVGPRPQMEVDFKKFSEHVQENIYNVKPGITGIGSIIFRDEEKWISESTMDPHEFYEQYIAPYKGEVELWYQEYASFWTDLKIIFLTAWVITIPKSELIYKMLSNLPPKPSV